MMCQMIGRPPISTIGLGRTCVSSAIRVPLPPARMTTLILFCCVIRPPRRESLSDTSEIRSRPHLDCSTSLAGQGALERLLIVVLTHVAGCVDAPETEGVDGVGGLERRLVRRRHSVLQAVEH